MPSSCHHHDREELVKSFIYLTASLGTAVAAGAIGARTSLTVAVISVIQDLASSAKHVYPHIEAIQGQFQGIGYDGDIFSKVGSIVNEAGNGNLSQSKHMLELLNAQSRWKVKLSLSCILQTDSSFQSKKNKDALAINGCIRINKEIEEKRGKLGQLENAVHNASIWTKAIFQRIFLS